LIFNPDCSLKITSRFFKIPIYSQAWWLTPVIPILGKKKDHCKLEASLIYIASSRSDWAIQRDPASKKPKTKKYPTQDS
jgi:hypothetical protein